MDGDDIGLAYIRTIPGLLRICEEVVNFIGMICIATAPGWSPRGDAFLASSIMALIITAVLIVFYITGFKAKLQLSWNKLEFGYSVFIAIFYLVTASLAVTIKHSNYIAAGVFGYIAILLYIADAFFQYQAVMSQ